MTADVTAGQRAAIQRATRRGECWCGTSAPVCPACDASPPTCPECKQQPTPRLVHLTDPDPWEGAA